MQRSFGIFYANLVYTNQIKQLIVKHKVPCDISSASDLRAEAGSLKKINVSFAPNR